MKKTITVMLLIGILLLGESFADKGSTKTSVRKNSPSYSFMVDGAPFDAMPTNNYTAMLGYDTPKATLTFFGNALRDKEGKVMPNKIEIEYTIRDGVLGDVNVSRITYLYKNEKYNLLPGSAFMSITKMKWNPGKNGFVMNADIFCKVQKTFVTEEFVPVFVIRGSMQNITVNLPMS